MANQNQSDRSAQVLQLLSELTDRLRMAENERDTLKRDLSSIRDTLQDLDDRNGQTQKAYLALENKFDAADTTVDSIIRRLTGMEESVDRQSGEMIGILRKIEERFETYDREYKNHAANITYYGEQLDRFDKRLEKLMAEKGRMGRKLDAMEFQVADLDDRLKMVAPNSDTPRVIQPKEPARPMLQVWQSSDHPQFMAGPVDVPKPARRYGPVLARFGQAAVVVVTVAAVATLMYMLASVIERPNGEQKASPEVAAAAIEPAPTKPAPEPMATALAVPAPTPTPVAAVKDTAPAEMFSSAIRAQMDAQMVTAKKLEDDDTARLMAEGNVKKMLQKIKRDPDLPRTIQAIEARAMEGAPEAQHDMGALYTSGQSGVGVDYARAANWFRIAAYNGVANARYNLGVLYQQGLGVEKDMVQALAWYRSAALLNHPEARYNLGIAYVEGIGTTYNPGAAAAYFEQAAKLGVIDAAYNLGLVFENGLIDEARPHEAMFWYQLASDRGSGEGALALKRLLTEDGMELPAWKKMYTSMLAARPDLKTLAESKATASALAPRVRVMTPAEAKNAARPNVAKKLADVKPPPAPAAATPSRVVEAKQKPVVSVPESTQENIKTIERIQAMLIDEGLFSGPITGKVGPMTANAITRYQKKYDMPIDGKPSMELLAQMLARRLAIAVEPAANEPAPSVPAIKDSGMND